MKPPIFRSHIRRAAWFPLSGLLWSCAQSAGGPSTKEEPPAIPAPAEDAPLADPLAGVLREYTSELHEGSGGQALVQWSDPPSHPVDSADPDSLRAWSDESRTELRAILGITEDRSAEPAFTWVRRPTGPGLSQSGVLRLMLEDGVATLVRVTLPPVEDTAAVVVLFHGHSANPFSDLTDPQTGVADGTLAEAGYVVVRPLLRGFGSRDDQGTTQPMPHARIVATANLRGTSSVALHVRDAATLLDAIEALASEDRELRIDSDSIVAAGHSLGALVATLLTIVDPRVDALVAQNFAGDLRRAWSAIEHCPCGFEPAIATRWNPVDLLAMVAPRPALVTFDPTDINFPIDEPDAHFRPLAQAYALMGAPTSLSVVATRAGHIWQTEPVTHWLRARTEASSP